MAHYALLNSNNVVVSVITGRNEDEMNIDWEEYYTNITGFTCKRTSYNTVRGIYFDSATGNPHTDQTKAFRKNYAGIGFTYDTTRNAFIPPKESDDQVLDEESCIWVYPYMPEGIIK